jgi:hypothetical protein
LTTFTSKGVGAELGVALGELRKLAGNAGDVPHLDVVGAERTRGIQQEIPHLVGLLASLRPLVLEEAPDELQLQVFEPVVVQELLDLIETATLEAVGEVGVPDPDPLHPGLGRLPAALGEVEVAPLLALVGLGRAGRRPVRAHQLDAVLSRHPHSSLP